MVEWGTHGVSNKLGGSVHSQLVYKRHGFYAYAGSGKEAKDNFIAQASFSMKPVYRVSD